MLSKKELDQFISRVTLGAIAVLRGDDFQLSDDEVKPIVEKATFEQFIFILSNCNGGLLEIITDREKLFHNKALIFFVLKSQPLYLDPFHTFAEKHIPHLYALSQVADLPAYNWRQHTRLVAFRARKLYWKADQPEHRALLDKIAMTARMNLPKNEEDPPALSSVWARKVTPKDAWDFLFSEEECESLVKRVIVELYVLLSDPEACVPYLKWINDEFLRYFRETYQREFPHVPADRYQFELFRGLFFPVPLSEDYIGIDKMSALQEYLMLFLQHHGLASDVFKWLGFIPNNIADRMVSDGHFFAEGLNNTALFHGKLIHMLQIAIAICAINDGKIRDAKHVNMKEVLRMIVTTTRSTNDGKVWGSLFDLGTHLELNFSFRDPFALHSAIMYSGTRYHIEGLANSFIDTFCKRYIKLVRAYNELGFGLSLASFAEKTKGENLVAFNPSKHIFEKFKQTSRGTLQEHGEDFAVFRKEYCPNRMFTPAIVSTSSQASALALETHPALRM